MSQPSLETIQCFLIIGNVLSYNMNPGVAYILLGMALRMAFTLGLQTDSHQFSGPQQYLRRRVWWALAWQDSHFSMSYDRPSSSALYGPEIPYRRTSKPGFRSYAESMFRIIQLTQEIIKGRMIKPDANLTWGAIRSYKEEITRIVAEGAPHLRERNNCTSKTQHLERVALKLHSSYITSELCRPALKEQDTCETDERRSSLPTSVSHSQRSQNHSMSPTQTAAATLESLTTQLRRECIANLVLTIDAYLEAHSISQHAARSWIGIQRAISAAFLLGITQESHYDQQIRNLLRNLEMVISEKTKMDSNFFDPTGFQSPPVAHAPTNTYGDVDGGSQGRFNSLTGAPGLGDSTNEAIPPKSPRWPRPMNQSLKALSKLNGALATPRPGSVTHLPPAFPPSAMNPGSVVGMDQLWSGQFSPGNPALVMPATPESSGSGEWNYGNLGERAAEYVQPALWG
jgi:Fungal specific transcription factor domain